LTIVLAFARICMDGAFAAHLTSRTPESLQMIDGQCCLVVFLFTIAASLLEALVRSRSHGGVKTRTLDVCQMHLQHL
jgi:hypothetical protein